MKDKRGKPKKPENETKAEAFVRIVNPRTIRAIATIRQISKCIKSQYYDVTQEQVDNILNGLQTELNTLRQNYDSRNKTTKKEDINGLLV